MTLPNLNRPVPTFALFSALLVAALGRSQGEARPAPALKDVRYGPHERNVLDF
jgi:hypothetical protein